jgi:hypothetical protein
MTVPKRFGVLRLLGWILKIIAWIVLVVSILVAVVAGVFASGSNLQIINGLLPADSPLAPLLATPAGGIAAGIGALLVGILFFLLIYAWGESFHLQLALEENTRLTAALLLRMHQESQQDNRYSGSGFENERFER